MLAKMLLWGLVLVPAVSPSMAHAALQDAVMAARSQACAGADQRPLRDDAKLRQAAQRMAAGASLSAALSSAGYLAAHSSALQLTGAGSDGDAARLLAVNSCAPLTDAKFQDIGSARRGPDVWVVLAAPLNLPVPTQAASVRGEILERVNRARAAGRRCGTKVYPRAPALTLNAVLTQAALSHSQYMAQNEVFDHRGLNGSSPAMRVARAGYENYAIVGENIAAGAMSAAEVTQGWLDSPAHCENIMDPRFSEIGIAFAVNRASAEMVYWTQDFATARAQPQNVR